MSGLILNSFQINNDEKLIVFSVLGGPLWVTGVPYIPSYLSTSEMDALVDLLIDWKGDFCWSVSFAPLHISALWRAGFLPIASSMHETPCFLKPKLHQKRCVMNGLEHLVIHKAERKKLKRSKHRLTIDKTFESVVQSVREQHGDDCWIVDPLLESFQVMRSNGPLLEDVQVHSIELWDERGSLIAGELGYSFGAYYCSMTGFRTVSGSGKVQLIALGLLLRRLGFKIWDLGMEMAYKIDIGASLMDRKVFVSIIRDVREDGRKRLEGSDEVLVSALVD